MEKKTDGRRKERVEKEIQQLISSYLIQNLQSELQGLVTVTRVMMPGDFRTAKVFVSFFPNTDEKIDFVKVLSRWASDIQSEISHKLKMKYVPKITFYKDESTESILKIEKIISEISVKNPPTSSSEDN